MVKTENKNISCINKNKKPKVNKIKAERHFKTTKITIASTGITAKAQPEQAYFNFLAKT